MPKCKYVMHLLRLLVPGQVLLDTGRVMVDVEAERDHLLAVRNAS